MLSVLNNRTYRHLFTAQVIALVGTGLMTVALGLLAYELAGADAGAVLGTALAIKMLAYAGVAPVAQAFADRLPRRSLLVALDLVRAAVALCLPFVTEVWQIYLLIFVLQAASAGFTPSSSRQTRNPVAAGLAACDPRSPVQTMAAKRVDSPNAAILPSLSAISLTVSSTRRARRRSKSNIALSFAGWRRNRLIRPTTRCLLNYGRYTFTFSKPCSRR